MSWVAVGAAAIGAVTAAQQRKAQQQANQQSSDVNAAQTQFSPWTGIKPQAFAPQAVTANALGGAVQGGLGGAMFAQGQKKNAAEIESLNAQTKMAGMQGNAQQLAGQMGKAPLTPWDEEKMKLMGMA